jgi:hypothetical protein
MKWDDVLNRCAPAKDVVMGCCGLLLWVAVVGCCGLLWVVVGCCGLLWVVAAAAAAAAVIVVADLW